MKKLIALTLAALLLAAPAACAAAPADEPGTEPGADAREAVPAPVSEQASVPAEESGFLLGGVRSGGWKNTDDIELTEEQKTIFLKAIEGLLGVGCVPFACLGTEIRTDRTYYCYLAQTTVVYPGAEPKLSLIYVRVDADGGAKLVNFAEMPLVPNGEGTRPMTPGEAVTGGWSYAADPAITDETALRFYDALSDTAGATYEPLVNVGTQVVAGLNRCILARVTPDDPDLLPRYAFVYVWEKPDGTSELYEIADDFPIGDLCSYET